MGVLCRHRRCRHRFGVGRSGESITLVDEVVLSSTDAWSCLRRHIEGSDFRTSLLVAHTDGADNDICSLL